MMKMTGTANEKGFCVRHSTIYFLRNSQSILLFTYRFKKFIDVFVLPVFTEPSTDTGDTY